MMFIKSAEQNEKREYLLVELELMYQWNRRLNIPPPLPQAFGIFSCPGEREFEEKFSKNSNVQEVVGGEGNVEASIWPVH